MKKIKIAIIDTGCSTKLLNQNINIIYDEKLQLSVNKHNKNEIEDNIGHGTMCIKNIMNKLKGYKNSVYIYPIKIFNNIGITSSKKLIEALYKISGRDINIINISLSTTDQLMRNEFIKVCSLLTKQGKLIIASKTYKGDEEGTLSIPAALDCTIGIDGGMDYNDNEFDICRDSKIDLVFNSKKYLYILDDHIDDFGLNSRATSLATAFITKLIIDNNISIISKDTVINELSKYCITKKSRVNKNEKRLKRTDTNILLSIYYILNRLNIKTTIYEIVYANILFDFFYYNNEKLLDFVYNINYEFNIDINLEKYSTEEMCNVFKLIDIIEQHM